MVTDMDDTKDFIRRAEYALHDMQGRVDAGKLEMFSQAIDRLEALAAERDRYLRHLTAGAQSINDFKARAEAAEAAITAALGRLDASLFTNAEHQQAKDILRAVKEGKE